MKNLKSIILAGLALVAVSCNKSQIQEKEVGYGTLQMAMSLNDMTKAQTDDQLYSSAVVNIYKDDFSGLVRSYNYTQIPSPFYLVAGGYRVDVLAGECMAESPAAASWDNKSYKGSTSFEVVANQVNSVEVIAYVNNAVTNITFDQSIADNFNAGYTFSIGLDPGDAATQLVYDAAKSGSEGYFIIDGLIEPSFSWTFNGTLAKDGSIFTKTGTISNIEAGKVYKMNLKYTIKDGDLNLSISVDYTTDIIEDQIVFEPVSTGLAPSSVFEIWAAHATLHADVDAEEFATSEVQFSYSSDGSNWTNVDGVNDNDGTYHAVVRGLAPSTEYTYKLVIDGDQMGDPLTFTTEAAPTLPNGSFEYASKVSGESYYKFYDPNCGVEEGSYMFWGSGNGEGKEGVNGSANMGIIITVIDTNDKVHGNQSVCAQTSSMVGILAAGNLFTGQFAGLVGTDGGKVNFGRPWTSRPTALKIYCKYTTDKMNIIKGMPEGVTLTKNDYDRAEIKFALGTWTARDYGGTAESPVHVNTTDPTTFVDFNTDKSTIANGNLVIHNDGYILNGGSKVAATTSGWIEYTIPLNYHDTNKYPTHIIISCAASQYGDYFTGSDKSKLWLDKAELVYE